MALLENDQLTRALTGMPYPARRWQMATWADINCATGEVREALRHIPDQHYTGLMHLIEVLDAIEDRARLTRGPAPIVGIDDPADPDNKGASQNR